MSARINDDRLARERLLVVGAGGEERKIVDDLRRHYPDWSVGSSATYLSGILELSRRPARAVLAWVSAAHGQVEHAVAGMRLASGPDTKLVLCSTPAAEPVARGAMEHGADDYVIYPLEIEELDRAVGYARLAGLHGQESPAAGVSGSELARLNEAIAVLFDRPRKLVEALARLLYTGMNARGVTVVVEGAAATEGEAVTRPVLTAALKGPAGVIGQVSLGERQVRPYTAADVERLTHYAAIAGALLHAAAQQRQWHRLAVTDECSGLPNRRYLHERLDEILARAAAERFAVTLLLFDVDDFKSYNDAFGHDAGDEVIRLTGRLFREHCREQDVVTRYGGDEFAVVFWDAEGTRVAGSAHPDCALTVLDRVQEALRSQKFPKLGPSAAGRLTISGGLATYPWDGATREALIQRADQALLAAKRAGKNRIFLIGDSEAAPTNTD